MQWALCYNLNIIKISIHFYYLCIYQFTYIIKIVQEFFKFLREYKILTLAITFIISVASSLLIKSLVDNIIMPITTSFISGGEWCCFYDLENIFTRRKSN